MAIHKLSIEGMHCMNACVKAVKEELELLGGVSIYKITVGTAEIEYDENQITRHQLEAAIEEAGFKLTAID